MRLRWRTTLPEYRRKGFRGVMVGMVGLSCSGTLTMHITGGAHIHSFVWDTVVRITTKRSRADDGSRVILPVGDAWVTVGCGNSSCGWWPDSWKVWMSPPLLALPLYREETPLNAPTLFDINCIWSVSYRLLAPLSGAHKRGAFRDLSLYIYRSIFKSQLVAVYGSLWRNYLNFFYKVSIF